MNESKLLSLLQREYNITPVEALTQYSEQQIQELLAQLPIDRIVHIQEGMKSGQIENRYLESFMDRDTTSLITNEEKAKLFEQRASIRAKIRREKDEEKLVSLNIKLKEITDKIENKGD